MSVKYFAIVLFVFLFVVGCTDKKEILVDESLNSKVKSIPQEKVIEEPTPEEPKVVDEEPLEETIPPEIESDMGEVKLLEELDSQIHLVEITADGFNPDTLTINTGDTVKWVNKRSGNLKQAMVIGNSPCSNIKSKMLMPGDEFSWTFSNLVKCKFVEAITITQIGEIIVEAELSPGL